MKQVRWFPLALLLGLVAFLAAPAEGHAVRSLDAAGAAGGTLVGNSFVIRDDGSVAEVQPAVAYNPDRGEYLVVFWNDRPGCDDIRAERVSRNGKLLGGVWVAAECPVERRYPDVAYNSQAQEYLVVWVVEDTGGNSYIRGRRLRGTDAQLLGGEILIDTATSGTGRVTNPAVAYASTANQYLVVWEREITSSWAHIMGLTVSGSGTPSPSSIFISHDPAGTPRRQPDVAYNRHANGFLVVWQQWDPAGLWYIWSCLVDGDGPPPSFSSQLLAYVGYNSTNPAVAAIPTAPTTAKFLVVYEFEFSPGDRDIHGRLVYEDGTPGVEFGIAAAVVDETSPAVAGTEYGYQYLVTWRHRLGVINAPIHGRVVAYGGALVGQEAEFGGPSADRPAVASGPVGDFLVAWQDKPASATNTNIYGRLWGNRVYLPLVLRNYH